MRRGVSTFDVSSLELLLDTMCNAFGGVMFLAMLLAILTQFAEAPSAATEEARLREQAALGQQAAQLREELAKARAQAAAAARLHPHRAMASLLETRTRQSEAAAEELARAEARAAVAGQQAAEAEAARAAAEKRVEQAKGQVRDALGAMKDQRADATRQIRMPQIRRLAKSPFWMIVKWNRLYMLHQPSRFSFIGAANERDVRQTRYEDYADYEPLRDRGVDLSGPWQQSPEVASLLSGVAKERQVLYFAVYPDSFTTFRAVRDFLVDKGYDYYWVMRPSDEEKLRLEFVTDRMFDGM
ncbi:MAG TPA: hypothetical protein P5137_05995 [Candidatus Brocadiia bacterium]|nr:hypothetical protein [Candidatus Brocadiia bacterium]